MNPRYLAYCRAHGRSPTKMLAYDTERFPGGKMCGFILWMQEQWHTFEKEHVDLNALRADERALWRLMNAAAFDVWLDEETS